MCDRRGRRAKVAGLPGWTGPMPSDWYSGFVSVGATKHLHYVFVEAETGSYTRAFCGGLRVERFFCLAPGAYLWANMLEQRLPRSGLVALLQFV